MSESLEARVTSALARIQNPRLDNDLLSAGMVRDLAVEPDGTVHFTFLLSREDPATLVRDTRKAVRAVAGVKDVRITVEDPSGAGPAPTGPPPPPPPPMVLPGVGKVVAVSSGKGGVGKSTIAANLAVALGIGKPGRVGLMDADIYGPNIPRMFGVFEKPPVMGGKIQPLEAHGVKLMSLGFLVDRDAPAIWRGPIIMKIVNQFLRDVAWGELDTLVVDLPPGTGDAQLSLVQATQVSGAIIITTPQEMAVGDALRGAKMFERVNVPVLGVVENMSGFVCPHCGETTHLFPTGGGQRLAEEVSVPLLGRIPLQAGLADHADAGRPITVAEPASPAAQALRDLAVRVEQAARARSVSLPILKG